MQTRNVFLALSFAIILIVVVGVLIARPNMDNQKATQVATQETLLQDGDSLIYNRCVRCHTIAVVTQEKRTRAEWEITLAQMEQKGATLSAGEKAVLIDYLTGVDEP